MSRRNITLRIPDNLMAMLKADAEANLRSVSATVHIILREHFSEQQRLVHGDGLAERIAGSLAIIERGGRP